MRTSFLITTITAALLAGTSIVSAQNPGADPKQEPKAAPNVQMKSQEKVQNNAQDKANSVAQDKGAKDKAAQEKAAQDKSKDKSKSTAQQRAPAASTTGQGMQRQTNSEKQRPAGQQPKASQNQGAGSSAQEQSQAQVGRDAPTLTAEQKTTIRRSVLSNRGAPRMANVNFSINVGTSVPRTVHLVAVPETLYRVHSAWRGHLYFIVGDEIIIVDRRTHQIVAVLEV